MNAARRKLSRRAVNIRIGLVLAAVAVAFYVAVILRIGGGE